MSEEDGELDEFDDDDTEIDHNEFDDEEEVR